VLCHEIASRIFPDLFSTRLRIAFFATSVPGGVMTPPSLHHGDTPPSGSFQGVQEACARFRRSQRIMLVVTLGSFSFLLLTMIYAATQLTNLGTSLTAMNADSNERISGHLDLMEQRISTRLEVLESHVVDVKNGIISIEANSSASPRKLSEH
jgi:hypothetical protein